MVGGGLWEDLRTFSGVHRPGTEFAGRVGVQDPRLRTKDIWFKDGATTGWTAGTLSSTEAQLFLPGIIGITESEGIRAAKVEKGRVFMMKGTDGSDFAMCGDSGSAVFKILKMASMSFRGDGALAIHPENGIVESTGPSGQSDWEIAD